MKIKERLETMLMRKQLIETQDAHKRALDNWGKEQAEFNTKVYRLRRVLLICKEVRKANIPSGLKNLEALLDEEVERVLEMTKS